MSHNEFDKQRCEEGREGRPDPRELLERYHLRDSDLGMASSLTSPSAVYPLLPQEHRRGRLRMYLGAAAGVGKTYALLTEGQRRKAEGTDVVVGYVETHRRAQTQAQLDDLEVIPRKHFTYRGITLEEMDTQAILDRHPQMALIDELAHSNIPGSKHPKRYQDVQDLLAAGIDVVTTLNVQHLESLNDLVASITGIEIHETLPDRILDEADEVELVDIVPQALRQRMKQGKIYPPERIEAALNNFFREGNLMALREFALRLTAEKTEEQLEEYMTEHAIHKTWETTERVLVGFDHRPQSRHVLRSAWRLAHGLDAELIAIHIMPQGYAALRHTIMTFLQYGKDAGRYQAEEQCHLEEHARLAEDLGAEVIQIRSPNVADALIEIARERRITQLVLGQPNRNRGEAFLRGSVINGVLHLSSEFDVYLVPLQQVTEHLEKHSHVGCCSGAVRGCADSLSPI